MKNVTSSSRNTSSYSSILQKNAIIKTLLISSLLYFWTSCTKGKFQKNQLKDQPSLVQKVPLKNTEKNYSTFELSELKYLQKIYQELMAYKDKKAYLVTETHHWTGTDEASTFYHLFYTKKEAENFIKIKKEEISITGVNVELGKEEILVDPDTIVLIIVQRYNYTDPNSPGAAFLRLKIEEWIFILNNNRDLEKRDIY